MSIFYSIIQPSPLAVHQVMRALMKLEDGTLAQTDGSKVIP